jgi:hypothetical protein
LSMGMISDRSRKRIEQNKENLFSRSMRGPVRRSRGRLVKQQFFAESFLQASFIHNRLTAVPCCQSYKPRFRADSARRRFYKACKASSDAPRRRMQADNDGLDCRPPLPPSQRAAALDNDLLSTRHVRFQCDQISTFWAIILSVGRYFSALGAILSC